MMLLRFPVFTLIAAAWLLTGCSQTRAEPVADPSSSSPMKSSPNDPGRPAVPTSTATFGAGCYWCVEAVLERLDGVLDVRSGFMGGSVPDPSYEAVCSGETGHAEVVQVDFDPARVSFEDLLGWFWQLHDPTTLNRQGADYGTQYRSVIFFHDEAQRAQALASKQAAQAQFADPIVTEISPASDFYEAKGEHQDFYRNNPAYGYCRAVIRPKMKKLGLEK
jgi:peptide-methionine (S)-S-oxide reductase